MDGVTFTQLRRIPTLGGDVRHALKMSDESYVGFGEAYFSTVERGAVKGWRRHNQMTLNLIVPCGEVRFLAHDEWLGRSAAFHLSPDRAEAYGRLTVAPGVWLAFGGLGEDLNLVLNVADLEHRPDEQDTRPLEAMTWTWSDPVSEAAPAPGAPVIAGRPG